MRQYIGCAVIRMTNKGIDHVVHVKSEQPRWSWGAAYLDLREAIAETITPAVEPYVVGMTIQVSLYTDESEEV